MEEPYKAIVFLVPLSVMRRLIAESQPLVLICQNFE